MICDIFLAFFISPALFCLAFISLRAKICLILLFCFYFWVGKYFAACFFCLSISVSLPFFGVWFRRCFMLVFVIFCTTQVCVVVCGKPSSARKMCNRKKTRNQWREGQISECVDSEQLSMCIFLNINRFCVWVYAADFTGAVVVGHFCMRVASNKTLDIHFEWRMISLVVLQWLFLRCDRISSAFLQISEVHDANIKSRFKKCCRLFQFLFSFFLSCVLKWWPLFFRSHFHLFECKHASRSPPPSLRCMCFADTRILLFEFNVLCCILWLCFVFRFYSSHLFATHTQKRSKYVR